MKYLILLVLLTMSCTDKKVTADPIVIEPIIAEVPKPEPIKLSYDKGLDLMLVDTMFTEWNTWKLDTFKVLRMTQLNNIGRHTGILIPIYFMV